VTEHTLASLRADAVLPIVPGIVALLDADGTVLDVSSGGHGDAMAKAIVGRRLHDLLPAEAAGGLVAAIRQALRGGLVVPYRYAIPDESGPTRYQETTIRPLGDGRVLTLARDASLDHHDRLTGLADRAMLMERLDAMLSDRGARATPAVLYVDIDYFKRVNDSLGYNGGDAAIVALADRIVEVVGDRGIVARTSGDEFVVALDHVSDHEEALDFAIHLRLAVARPLPFGTGSLHLTASVGVALPDQRTTADALVRDADTALHAAKAGGRNRHVLFDPARRSSTIDRVELEAALHTALEEDELRVHYQPVIDLAGGHAVGVEALVRWERPGHGLVPPGDFVPVAEQAGIINELGVWVLRHAARDAAAWHAATGLNVAVNVSASQLTDPGLTDAVLDALADAELPGNALSLELTETAYTSASDAAVAALQAVRERGVRIALDDFGSGYSSLERVRRFPVDVIKIDRSSVVALPNGERDVTIVRAIIELAHALGVPVVAEGVEVMEEHDALVRLGCDLAQGFLYARPLPPDQLAERLGLSSYSSAKR
jgi:diguanylate cyclase (GGDEF)-like protein